MPIGGLLDRDQALEVGPRLLEQRALRQQVAGRVAADVGRVRGQVEELLLGAEHDLDLLDRAAVAGQAVVDPGADQPAAELGERPVQRRRPRRCSRGGAGTRPCRRRAPGGSRPGASAVGAERAPRSCRRTAPGRAGRASRRRRRPTRPAPRRPRRCAPSPSWTSVRVRSARPGAPTAQRTTIGRSRRTPAGTSTQDALRPQRPGSAGRTCRSAGSDGGAVEQVAHGRRRHRAAGASDDAGGSRASRTARRRRRVLVELDQAVGVVGGRDHTSFRAVVGREHGASSSCAPRRSMYGV